MAINTPNSSKNASSEQQRPEKISDALKVLDEVLAGRNADLKAMVTDDFRNLKAAISDMAPRVGDTIRGTGNQAGQAFERVSNRFSEFASDGVEKSRQIYGDVEARVKSNPWPVIGGVAVGTFALGFILGRSGGSNHNQTYPQ